MARLDFPKDFVWGTATASYQVEGAVHEDGRGECIWDTFARKPGAVFGGESGAVACDHYHRYKEDIALMAGLGFSSYRFSIAWPRVLPDGRGPVNQAGLDFYRKLCDELHAQGMSAVATIYHWDLPQPLEDAGGWPERETALLAGKYAAVLFKELGACVDSWITINEPWCVAYLGYAYGEHAPGKKDMNLAMRAVHHVNLAHGLMVKAHREAGLKTPIGANWNLSTPRPATVREKDREAALIARAFDSEVFTQPVLRGSYPDLVTQRFGVKLPVEAGDMELIGQKIDFIGMNYYTESAVSWDESAPRKYKTEPSWQTASHMDWYDVPYGLLRQLRWVHEISGGKIPLYITENGYARDDKLEANGRVHDTERIVYLQRHLKMCSKAIKEGIELKGYYAWSFLDNYEWAWGYTRRFGIVYCDFKTQNRHPKDSAYFFRDLIAGYGEW
jgi:beta-glucosidase